MRRDLRDKLDYGDFRDVTPVTTRTMSAVRSRGNKTTEARLRAGLVRSKIRGWVLHPRGQPGNPDFYFPGARLAVFVDGCFWHGCERCGHIPKTNTEFWIAKIERNRVRDKAVTAQLQTMGIGVLRFWEHEITDDLTSVTQKIAMLRDTPLAPPADSEQL